MGGSWNLGDAGGRGGVDGTVMGTAVTGLATVSGGSNEILAFSSTGAAVWGSLDFREVLASLVRCHP